MKAIRYLAVAVGAVADPARHGDAGNSHGGGGNREDQAHGVDDSAGHNEETKRPSGGQRAEQPRVAQDTRVTGLWRGRAWII